MNRTLAAARLQLVHPAVILGVPWAVAGSSFAINWGVWALAGLGDQPDAFTGGVLSLYVTVAVVSMQSVTQLLPFAMGLSLSRRTYWTGVALVAVATSLGHGCALAVLGALERATGGWGVGLEFWVPPGMTAGNPVLQVLVSGAPMLAFNFAGVGFGVVTKRWGPSGAWALVISTILALGGLVVLTTWLHAWDEIGRWLADRSLETLTIALPLALAAALAALSHRGIRRVVP